MLETYLVYAGLAGWLCFHIWRRSGETSPDTAGSSSVASAGAAVGTDPVTPEYDGPAFNVNGAPMAGSHDIRGNPYGFTGLGYTSSDFGSTPWALSHESMFSSWDSD